MCGSYTLQLRRAGSSRGDRDDRGPLVEATRVNVFLLFQTPHFGGIGQDFVPRLY